MTKKIKAWVIPPDGNGRPRLIEVDPDELVTDPSLIYEPLVDALANQRPPDDTLAIPPAMLNIEPRWRSPRQVVDYCLRNFRTITLQHQEHDQWILVMRRQDGSFWVYDDCPYVQTAWQVAPDVPLRCAVWDDPTQ